MTTAIHIENLGKRYRLGETHEHTLSDQFVRIARRLTGRAATTTTAPEDFWALRDVNLDIAEGEAVGIIGGNGAGKSTLLKVLSRITQPTTGRALVRGRLASLLEVGTGFHPELTGRENVYLNGTILGMRKAEVERKFDEIVAFSGVEQFIDTPVKRYSSGMYVRLAFAVAAHLEPDVLIIDEVLAVGDAEFQKRCLGKMGDVAREGRTVLFVSHNMAAIQKLCSRVVWLQAGQVSRLGDPSEITQAYLADASTSATPRVDLAAGEMFRQEVIEESASTATVTVITLSDINGNPLNYAMTWQDVTLGIEFNVTKVFRSFAVELCISTPDGLALIVTSTEPDRTLAFGVEPGRYRVKCYLGRLALAAGEYVVGLRLAIPWVEYVCRLDDAFRLRVEATDVFGSGFAPTTRRCLVVVPHEWTAPERLTVDLALKEHSQKSNGAH